MTPAEHNPAQWPLPTLRDGLPGAGWLPVDIVELDGRLCAEWLWFGGIALTDSFFHESVHKARSLPVNRFLGWATPIEALEQLAGVAEPDGLVFHMSRCGSTLVAQMLGAMDGTLALGEPPMIDIAIQLVVAGRARPALLHGMLAALLRHGDPRPGRRFVKLDAWHTLALPLLRREWPDTPWIFLYRDPVEVLVSQAARPGMHVHPGVIRPEAYGVTATPPADPAEHGAWMIGLLCRAALAALPDEKALLVNYTQLPGAVAEQILPHFGVTPDEADRAALARAARQDAKAPVRSFASDSESKHEAATPQIHAHSARWLDRAFELLEQARRSGGLPTALRSAPKGPAVRFDW